MLPQGFEYHNGDGTLCLIGSLNEQKDTFTDEHSQSIDYGIDFYAPQTILTQDGRRVMIGWMQNWDTCNVKGYSNPWFGQMSLPRELSIKNGRLYQTPVRELEELRRNRVACKNEIFSGLKQVDGVSGRRVDMEITVRPAVVENGVPRDMYRKFAVRFAQNDKYQTSLSFHPSDSIMKIDRKFSGSRRAIIHQRRSEVNSQNGELKIRLILDRYSVEVFINDGEQVMSAVLYTDLDADGISFLADGMVSMDLVKYDLIG